MSRVQHITIIETDDGARLDRWFKRQFPHIAHGRVEKLLRKGEIRVEGKRAKGNQRLEAGQSVRVPPLPDPSEVKTAPPVNADDVSFMRNMIIHEAEDFYALNKPAGLAVQGGTKTTRHIDGLLPALGEGCRLVHRLDRDTSGVLLIAKNVAAASRLGKAFAHRKAEKIYWGVTNGVPHPKEGEIKGYIAKGQLDNRFGKINEGKEVMMAVRHGAPNAKYAKTLFRVVSSSGKRAAWVVMQPLTGRTHQLRLHMQLAGSPLVGDPRYLTDREAPGGLEERLHLHARSLTLPINNGGGKNKELYLEAPLPKHFVQSFDRLGFDAKTPIEPLDEEI